MGWVAHTVLRSPGVGRVLRISRTLRPIDPSILENGVVVHFVRRPVWRRDGRRNLRNKKTTPKQNIVDSERYQKGPSSGLSTEGMLYLSRFSSDSKTV